MKRILSVLLILLFMAQIFSVSAFAANESGSPKHIPRIVSVVFDDSGSMYKNTDRWAYASYAMQAFVAMMGDEDVLYVTYLNAPSGTVKINLADSAKQGNIENIEKTMFGGGTPNKLSDGAQPLKNEYAKYGSDAKYYLVVLCDGVLDAGQGEMADELRKISASTSSSLSGADFETVYFAMYNDENEKDIVFENIPGVSGYSAKNGNEIVNVLRNISADIMGRTKIDFNVSGGKLSFELEYPALSIAVFVQKQNTKFSNVRVPITRNGGSVSYSTGVYYVDCPTDIVKNTAISSVYTEKVPANPPGGFVTLIENGNGSIEKGSYTIDFSSLGISAGDLVVLVEPAVKIGCKYYIGDNPTAYTFDEVKTLVHEGDDLVIECGLYEMKSDGSLGDAVPLNVLSPDYKVYINDSEIGNKVGENKYEIKIGKEHENKELKIEAVLEGYQPFVLRESFGELKPRIEFDPNGNGGNGIEITLTKPELQDWINGSKEIRFPLVSASNAILNDLSIRVEGFGGLQSGVCSTLGNVSVSGNDIVYTPRLSADTVFSQLPQSFRVVLVDNTGGSDVAAANVTVIQPKYRFEITNQLANQPLNLGMLKANDKSLGFKLTACYDGSESYSPISNFTCERDISISVSNGVLTGETNLLNSEIYFTPKYDSAVNTDVSPSDIVGSDHTVYATATVDGIAVESEKITLTVAGGSYKIEVDNPITEAFTLDTVKTNTQKIVFSLLADYNGDGNYGAVEDWDLSVYEKLSVTSGDLSGIFETVYDAGGKVIGKAFTPKYDELNNNGIVFTRVAGKVHTVKAELEGGAVAETTVEVLPPKYDIEVIKDGITLVDVELRGNTEGVSFAVLRDGRRLTAEELAGLEPFQAVFSKEQNWMALDVKIREDSSGSYVSCVPIYDGWTFISDSLWNWLCLFKVDKGDMTVDITVGLDSASAAVKVETSEMAWIIFFVSIGVLAFVLWIVFCCLTRVRFTKGYFYVVPLSLAANGLDYKVGVKRAINPNKGSLIRFILSGKIFVPFSEQSCSVTVNRHKAAFVAKKSPFKKFAVRSFPYSKTENGTHFNHGHLEKGKIVAIVNRDVEVDFDPSVLIGAACGDNDIKMSKGQYLCEHNSTKIIVFVTKKEEKKIKEATRRARRNNRA